MNRGRLVYILRCGDGSDYVGCTDAIEKRVAAHNAGQGAAWTARRRPVRLVFLEQHETESSAARRERQIKRWSRAKKEALIAGDTARLRALSKRKGTWRADIAASRLVDGRHTC